MTLDNSAKIGDIITALEGMQGINQKGELASVIGTPVTASDNIATQITKLQDAKDVLASKIDVPNTTPLQAIADALVVGKKWASGTAVSASSATNYEAATTTTTRTAYAVTVNGLDFKPSTVIMSNGTNIATVSELFPDILPSIPYKMINSGQLDSNAQIKLKTPAKIGSSGFSLPFNIANTQVTWIAIE